MTSPSRRSEPGALQRLLLSLRPAISDLFAGYAVPAEDASRLLREAVEMLALHCHRSQRPREFFLEMLESSCRTYIEEQRAQESEDDDPPDP